MRPLVEHAENRQGITVLDARNKVALTGHRNDATRAALHHNAPRDGAPGGERKTEAESVTQIEERAYLTGAAAPAILWLG